MEELKKEYQLPTLFQQANITLLQAGRDLEIIQHAMRDHQLATTDIDPLIAELETIRQRVGAIPQRLELVYRLKDV